MSFKRMTIAAVAAFSLVLTGCSQDTSESGNGSGSSPAAEAENDFTLPEAAPDGFKDGLRIAMVRQSGIGDYFEQWGNGAIAQMEAAGVTVDNYDARGDNADQVQMLTDAINSDPDALIVGWGLADSVNPKIDEAIEKGIPVVVYDAAVTNPEALYLSQDDEAIATLILDELKAQNPDGGTIGYVNVSGIAPLDSRDKVYQKFLDDNPTFKEAAKFGKYSESVANDTAAEAVATFQANPDINIVFAAYDELAKGALIGLRQVGMADKVKMYGVDISTADIQLMTEAGSPWVATAATDPANVGKIVARAAIAAASGVDLPSKMTIPAALITQQMLLEKGVTNMEQLRAAMPDLATPKYLGAPWIPEVTQ